MSSIERAMDKIGGDSPADARDDASVAAEAVIVSSQGQASVAAPVSEAAREAKVKTNVAASVTQAEPALDAARPAPVLDNNNYINIDFARLAAAGFLTPDQPMTRQSEEYQHIKRRVLGNMVPGALNSNRPSNLILITSSVPSEGKTFTSVNLAISIAMEVDHTILVVDTDIMKRDLSRTLGVVDRKGLFDLLASPHLKLEDLLVRTNMRNLVVLPVGTRRDGSTELLASMRMRELADEIALRYRDRVVLFDSPPVLATTTASALAPLVGQVILVAEAGSTKHETIREALQRLDRVTITGVIMNKAKQVAASSYDYYGSYYRETR